MLLPVLTLALAPLTSGCDSMWRSRYLRTDLLVCPGVLCRVLSGLVGSGLVCPAQVASRFCAFVTFTERAAAEKAAEVLHNKLMIKGVRLRLMWGRGGQAGGRSQPQQHDPMQPIPSGKGPAGGAAGGPPQQAAMAAAAAQHNFFGLPAEGAGGLYPSMDPSAQGSAMKRPGEQQDGRQADKRPRGSGGPTGYGAPPPMPPPGMPMPPPHMMMALPGYGMPPPMGMFPPPGAFPPPAGFGGPGPLRPPMGAPPPVAAAGPAPSPATAAPAAAAAPAEGGSAS